MPARRMMSSLTWVAASRMRPTLNSASSTWKPPGASFVFDVSVATAKGLVTDIQITSGAAGAATLSGAVITLPIGPGADVWRTTFVDLKSQIANVAADTLVEITGFKAHTHSGQYRPLLR